jgi:hypothetical protein
MELSRVSVGVAAPSSAFGTFSPASGGEGGRPQSPREMLKWGAV